LVSLQNCSVKALCKALTFRLQQQITTLIDIDQMGFLNGRSISENFVYVTELVQTCFRRKAPTVVLKLDFAKAFDSISCSSLRSVMLVGPPFGVTSSMTSSPHHARRSSSTVFRAGGFGACGACSRVTPYRLTHSSFVADVLQRLAWRDDVLMHPLVDGAPCPVLQYAAAPSSLCALTLRLRVA
jgi:hypothetical protein